LIRPSPRYSSENTPTYIDAITDHTPASLLKGIVDNQLSVGTVISDRAIKSSEEAQKIIQALSRAAVQHNYREIVEELGRVEMMGSSLPDPYLDVPEVRPVTITTVGFTVLASSVIETPSVCFK
jgi:DNA-directed RNA polymerase